MYLWPSDQRRRIQLQKAQFKSQEGRTPIPYFCYCSVITVDVVNLWFKINDGRGGSPNWAMFSDIWLLLLLCLKSWGVRGAYNHSVLWVIAGLLVKHFVVLTTLWMKEMRNWGRSGITSYCSIVCCESSSWLWLKTGAWGEKSIG